MCAVRAKLCAGRLRGTAHTGCICCIAAPHGRPAHPLACRPRPHRTRRRRTPDAGRASPGHGPPRRPVGARPRCSTAATSMAADVVAVIGKTEGNGGVNDFTRGYARADPDRVRWPARRPPGRGGRSRVLALASSPAEPRASCAPHYVVSWRSAGIGRDVAHPLRRARHRHRRERAAGRAARGPLGARRAGGRRGARGHARRRHRAHRRRRLRAGQVPLRDRGTRPGGRRGGPRGAHGRLQPLDGHGPCGRRLRRRPSHWASSPTTRRSKPRCSPTSPAFSARASVSSGVEVEANEVIVLGDSPLAAATCAWAARRCATRSTWAPWRGTAPAGARAPSRS